MIDKASYETGGKRSMLEKAILCLGLSPVQNKGLINTITRLFHLAKLITEAKIGKYLDFIVELRAKKSNKFPTIPTCRQ